MKNSPSSPTTSSEPRSDYAKALNIPRGKPILVEYFTKPTSILPSFLPSSPPADTNTMTLTTIDFPTTALPENKGRLAIVLDNVLSPSECETLLSLAESSVDLERLNVFWNTPGDTGPWRPAMVNAGQGYEVLEPGYRNSDRIVWDSEEVVARLWARCMQGEIGQALEGMLGVLDGEKNTEVLGGGRRGKRWVHPEKWAMKGLNRRMRFLKYGPGQFFRREFSCHSNFSPSPCTRISRWKADPHVRIAHCDGNYSEKVDDTIHKTFFTVHLYLNDSKAEAGEEASLVGGATSFLADDGSERKVDVDPKAGRVLIFQQQGLLHAGDDVVEGTKYTMRTEIMYELLEKAEWVSAKS